MAVKREQAKEYLALMLSQSKAHESDNALVAFLESAEMDGPVLLQKRYAPAGRPRLPCVCHPIQMMHRGCLP